VTLVLAASTGKTFWYLTRGTGVVSLILLTAVVLLGIGSTIRWRKAAWPRFVVADLHRNLTLASILFIVLHVLTTVADGYTPIGLKDAIVPFLSPYRPIWLGLGAVAFDLLLAVVLTSMLRVRVGYRVWHALHWTAYAAWPLAVVHGLGTGSDSRMGAIAVLTIACIAAVALLLALRLARSPSPSGVRLAGGAATLASVVIIVAWYQSGPLRSGWAARAGTPTRLLFSRRQLAGATVARQRGARPTFTLPFNGSLDARLARSADSAGDVGIAIGGNVRGTNAAGVLLLKLWGAQSGEGVAMTDSHVTFSPVGSPGYSGQIVELDGNRLVASLSDNRHDRLLLAIDLRIDPSTSTVSGTVRGSA
jgi:methionine sulfoxide reductase heme-binding subunit